MSYRVEWANPCPGPKLERCFSSIEEVCAFSDGLRAMGAYDIVIYGEHSDPWPEPWTFGDLEVGDWFVVPGSKNARQKATAHHSTLDDGSGFMDHMAADPVEPFEWEWSE